MITITSEKYHYKFDDETIEKASSGLGWKDMIEIFEQTSPGDFKNAPRKRTIPNPKTREQFILEMIISHIFSHSASFELKGEIKKAQEIIKGKDAYKSPVLEPVSIDDKDINPIAPNNVIPS